MVGCNSDSDSDKSTPGQTGETKTKEITAVELDKALEEGFTINSNGLLTDYHGDSYDVVIPDIVRTIGNNVFTINNSHSKQGYLIHFVFLV